MSSFYMTAMLPTILIVATGILFVSSLILNQNHTAIAQRQQPQEQPFVSKEGIFCCSPAKFL
jgi:cytoskeletal protein RodZ